MPAGAEHLLDLRRAAQAVEQARLPIDTEAPVQFTAPDVAVDQDDLVARLGEAQRKVGRDQ